MTKWSKIMKSFEFKLYGGFTLTFDKEALTIDVKGMKGLFFQRVKPRHKVIPYDQILRVDYKGAGMTVGYIRFITPELVDYPSSMYVAEHDENSLIFEKDELEKFNELMNYIHKKLPQVEKELKKM